MQPVDAYLVEVSKNLPSTDKEDILAELRSNIEDEIEQWQDDSTSPSYEQAAISTLKRFGHPLKVAASYNQHQHLIGPDLYPIYVHTLKSLLVLVLSIQLVVTCVLGLAAEAPWQATFAGLFSQLLSSAAWVAAIVTAVFVGIDYSGEKLGWYDNWEPNALKLKATATIARGDLMTNLITAVVFLLWWNGVVSLPSTIDYAGESLSASLSSSWLPLFWPLNALVGISVLLYLLVLARGYWQRSTTIVELILNTLLIVAGIWLLSNGPLLQIHSSDALTMISDGLQRTIRIVVVVVVGFTLWDTWLAWKRLGTAAPGAPADPLAAP